MAETEHVFPSPTWEWRKVKIRRPAGGQKAAPKAASRWYGRARWPDRKPLTVTVKFRGGSECWYEIHARGAMGRFPGYLGIDDIMSEIMRRDSPKL